MKHPYLCPHSACCIGLLVLTCAIFHLGYAAYDADEGYYGYLPSAMKPFTAIFGGRNSAKRTRQRCHFARCPGSVFARTPRIPPSFPLSREDVLEGLRLEGLSLESATSPPTESPPLSDEEMQLEHLLEAEQHIPTPSAQRPQQTATPSSTNQESAATPPSTPPSTSPKHLQRTAAYPKAPHEVLRRLLLKKTPRKFSSISITSASLNLSALSAAFRTKTSSLTKRICNSM